MEAKDFRALRISLASPDHITSWSYGEVTKPETINYRRLRPEKDGLFCEAIFGPTRDWQCYCGKYKNIRYKGITCDKCGVEVTRASVRRERMGHITLAAPVAHVWYTRRVPSYLGLLLDISRRNLDRVLYFAQYVITQVDEEARQKALKRIEEELARQEASLGEQLNDQLTEMRADRDADLGELQTKIEAINERYNTEFAEASDAVMREAKLLQDRIEGLVGETISDDVRFDATDQIIAEAGTVIANEHLSKIQESVNARLNELQADIEERRTAEIAQAELGIDSLNTDSSRSIEEQQQEKLQTLNQVRATAQESRAELEALQVLQFLGEPRYRELKSKFGQVFKANMGAEAFYDILKNMNLDKLSVELWHEVRTTRSKQRKKKATKRLRVVESLRKSDNRPEWMILSVLPVIPPDLRPMVQLDGGRFATSDLNDLYRRVINRNNRLKRLLELGAPDVIVRNEKRMLQEAVDSLIDNSQRGKALSRRGRRELKSLSDMLKGKKGRFRRNLLGKRVDYSGRSVIVIGPKLKLHQCGLPKVMALELFRPFVISKLVQYNYASNVKGAKRIIEAEKPEVWEVLEEVIKDRPVLLNRAPTLHRLGIQAFEPTLVEGKAIQIHPLVCAAFNADFDGDQMAVHVPLSDKAVKEARELMLSTRNLLKPSDGAPIVGPSKDMVLGNYYLTMDPNADIITREENAENFRTWSIVENARIAVAKGTTGERVAELRRMALNNEIVVFDGEYNEDGKPIRGRSSIDLAFEALINGDVDCMLYNGYDFKQAHAKNPEWPLIISNLSDRRLVVDMDEVEVLYGLGIVDLHTPILLGNIYDDLPAQPEPEIATIGRAVFNRILPDKLRFIQEIMDKKALQQLVARSYQVVGGDETTEVVDSIKNLGFHYATISGTTIAVSDLTIPEERENILTKAGSVVDEAERSFRRGLLTEEERYQITIDSWTQAKSDLSDVIKDSLDPFGPIAIMALSGSTKGGFGPITQLAGMRGLMADPSGRIIDLPIQSHFRMGLDALEYFISSHGARKGLADTALRTADAGYLTRRLVDVAQDMIVNNKDCETEAGIWIKASDDVAGQQMQERIVGRFAAKPVVNPATGEVIVGRNEIIEDYIADAIVNADVEEVCVRSPMTCALVNGICIKCYGRDLGRGDDIRIGTAVGIVAAQSIGEPGTQLTLRTFHTGGTAQASGDITSGLPRVEELFEARKKPKGEAVMTDIAGVVRLSKTTEGVRLATIIDSEVFNEQHEIPKGYELLVEDDDQVKEGQEIAKEKDGEGVVVAAMAGQIYLEAKKVYIRYERREELEYEIPSSARLMPEIYDGAQVRAGQQLTEGAKNPHRILRILGQDAAQLYLLTEVQKVYRSQGVPIADKHFEVIIRKMLSKAQITRSGDTTLLPGELIDRLELMKINEGMINDGKAPATGVPVLLGVTKAALSTDSFLSASSFQHTIKVLAGAAIEGKEDPLHGLKENVIIGKLIPAGTGFQARHMEESTIAGISSDAMSFDPNDDDTFTLYDEPESEVGDIATP